MGPELSGEVGVGAVVGVVARATRLDVRAFRKGQTHASLASRDWLANTPASRGRRRMARMVGAAFLSFGKRKEAV